MSTQQEKMDPEQFDIVQLKKGDMSLFSTVPIIPIEDDEDYETYLSNLDNIIELQESKINVFNMLTRNGAYLESLIEAIQKYEEKEYSIPDVTGIEMLRFLMEQNELTQSDFADEIGPQGNVSKILAGERNLSLSHIKKLSKRFGVNADLFIGDMEVS